MQGAADGIAVGPVANAGCSRFTCPPGGPVGRGGCGVRAGARWGGGAAGGGGGPAVAQVKREHPAFATRN